MIRIDPKHHDILPIKCAKGLDVHKITAEKGEVKNTESNFEDFHFTTTIDLITTADTANLVTQNSHQGF